MKKLVNGALVGVVAFVVLAPVFAWIMPRPDTPAPDGPSADADGSSNPFVPLPKGESAMEAPSVRRTDEPTKDREEGRGIISFDIGGDGDDDEDDEDHEDDDRRDWRKSKHKWRDD